MIPIKCSKCGSEFEIDDSFEGHVGNCRQCGNQILVKKPASPDTATPDTQQQEPPKSFTYKSTHGDVNNANTPTCMHCGGNMRKSSRSTSSGCLLALIVFLIGGALSLTIMGAIIGVPIMIVSLFMGTQKIWKCRGCGAVIERQGWF